MIALIAEAALRSLALGGAVWLAMLAFRPRNPHLQKTVWLTVLLASIAMPFVLAWRVAPSFDAPEYLVTIAQGGGPVAPGKTVASAFAAFSGGLVVSITAAYVLVALSLIARFAAGLLRIWRIRRSAVPLTSDSASGFDIRVTPKVLSPATFGSTILLPAEVSEWSEAKLEAVLSHERSHVRFKDCYVLWLARMHACIFWFNPLAWWLNRRLAELAETTSDDAVIAALPDRTAYADMLLEIARNPAPGRVVMSAARPNISARIERIISNIPPASPPRRWVRGLAVAALIPLTAMAAATLQVPSSGAARAGQADPGPADTTRPVPFSRKGPVSNDPMAPKIIDPGDHSEKNYPVTAKRHGINGLVRVGVTIDAEGRLIDAQVLSEYPTDKDWGFGAAALNMARTMRFSNPSGRTAQLKYFAKFELKEGWKPPQEAFAASGAASGATPPR
jgi:TonB family protein